MERAERQQDPHQNSGSFPKIRRGKSRTSSQKRRRRMLWNFSTYKTGPIYVVYVVKRYQNNFTIRTRKRCWCAKHFLLLDELSNWRKLTTSSTLELYFYNISFCKTFRRIKNYNSQLKIKKTNHLSLCSMTM